MNLPHTPPNSNSEAPVATDRRPTGTRFTRMLGFAALIGIVWLVVFGLFLSPNDLDKGASVRILYIHVPAAWLAYLAFIVTGKIGRAHV